MAVTEIAHLGLSSLVWDLGFIAFTSEGGVAPDDARRRRCLRDVDTAHASVIMNPSASHQASLQSLVQTEHCAVHDDTVPCDLCMR